MTLSVRSLALPIAIAVVVLVPVTATSQSTLGPREDNISLNGTRLTYYPRPSVDQCQSDCASNGNCQGFTWIKAGTYNPGDAAMCYLLSAVTRRNSARGHISSVKGGGGAQVGTREDNISLNGTRLTYYPRPSVDQCESDCANNGNCQGFTWIKAGTYNPGDGAMCYLMSAVTRRNPARGHISAVKGGESQVGGSYSLSATSNARSGETISVSFTAPSPSAARDWIGLFKEGAKNNDHGGRWKYTDGRTSGTLTFTAPAEPGQYEFRYLLSDGYTDVRSLARLTVGR